MRSGCFIVPTGAILEMDPCGYKRPVESASRRGSLKSYIGKVQVRGRRGVLHHGELNLTRVNTSAA